MKILKEFEATLIVQGLNEFEVLRKAGAPRTEDYEMGLEQAFKLSEIETKWFMNALFLARPNLTHLKSIRVALPDAGEAAPEGARKLGSAHFGDHYYILVYNN